MKLLYADVILEKREKDYCVIVIMKSKLPVEKPSLSLFMMCMTDENEMDSSDKTAESNQALNTSYSSVILSILSFLTLNRHRPGIFVASFLVLRGWQERNIGFVLFFEGIVSLLVQTPVGNLIDITSHKRLMIAIANLLISFSSILLIFFTQFAEVLILLTFQGIGIAMGYPAIYGITLGIVGHSEIVNQVTINESSTHAGNAMYAVIAGVCAIFFSADGIFWTCLIMGVSSTLVLALVDESTIDPQRARGLDKTTNSSSPPASPTPLFDLLKNPKVMIFFLTVALFHLSNAAMLPLLSQHLSIHSEKRGISFTAACIVIAQLFMVLSSAICAPLLPRYGKKILFIISFCFIPIRGVIVMLLLKFKLNLIYLISTQVLDGLAGGIFSVVAVLIVEDFTRYYMKMITIILLNYINICLFI